MTRKKHKTTLKLLSLSLIMWLGACSDTAQNDPPPVKKDMGDMGTKDIGQTDCRDIDKDGFFGGINCPKANDCDDTNGEINPDATEVCGDRVDNNCNMQVDENCPCQTGEVRLCSSHGDPQKLGGPEIRCKPGVQRCIEGAWSETCEGEIGPEEETCNNMDSDCNGQIDDGVRNAFGLCIKDLPPDWMPPVEDCGPTGEGNGLDDNGDGQVDEGCSCITPDFDPNLPRTNQPCYSGAPATLGVGICKGGSRDCLTGGIWGACGNEVTPEAEVCGDGLDNNCNGIVDDGCSPCVPTGAETCDGIDNDCNGIIDDGVRNACGGCGEVATDDTCGDGVDNNCNGRVDENCPCSSSNQFCYIGPAEAAGVGACVKGKQLCAGEFFGKCEGSVLPGLEQCNTDGSPNGIDEDCDGQVDEICGCPEGAQRPCGSNTGVCTYGMQTCTTGVWGECAGGTAKAETDETLCDGLDNDCDGLTDEGLLNACGKCNEACYTQGFDPTQVGNADMNVELIPANDPSNPRGKAGISLSKATAFPSFIWAANSDTDGVSKVNTDTDEEVARYWVGDNPSRTAVDLNGNMWVIGRNDGRVTQVAWNERDCIDRNNNGTIETSKRVGGMITVINSAANPMADECVLFSQVLNTTYPSGRGVTVDPTGRVWFGYSHNTGVSTAIQYVDPTSGDPATYVVGPAYPTANIPEFKPDAQGVYQPTGNTATYQRIYGLTADSQGRIYAVDWDRRELSMFNTATMTWEAYYETNDCDGYGIALDGKDRIWSGCVSTVLGGGVSVYDPATNKMTRFVIPASWVNANSTLPANGTRVPASLNHTDGYTPWRVTAVAVEPATGDVWTTIHNTGLLGRLHYNEANPAASEWTIVRASMDDNGVRLPEASSLNMRGIGFDRLGKVWHLGTGMEHAMKIDPATNTREALVPMVGAGGHYTYSDFSGSSLFSFTAPRGNWRHYFDTTFADAIAHSVLVEAHVPAGTTLGVRIRPLDNNGNPLGDWIPGPAAQSPYMDYPAGAMTHTFDLSQFGGPAMGTQFEIDLLFTTTDQDKRPIIYDIELGWERP